MEKYTELLTYLKMALDILDHANGKTFTAEELFTLHMKNICIKSQLDFITKRLEK